MEGLEAIGLTDFQRKRMKYLVSETTKHHTYCRCILYSMSIAHFITAACIPNETIM